MKEDNLMSPLPASVSVMRRDGRPSKGEAVHVTGFIGSFQRGES